IVRLFLTDLRASLIISLMKKFTLICTFMFLFLGVGLAQESSYQLSSHILDITQGKPAPNVKISLYKQHTDGKWLMVEEKLTDENGRVKDFLKEDGTEHDGIYKLVYHVKLYFDLLGQETFYPFIEVVFELKGRTHYHVPITLSPYGYSTYRGN
ncbi:hydroxyisourate hydrolase, partial [Phocaeicola coprocola]